MNLNDTFLNGYTFAFCEKRNFTKGQGWRWALEEMVRTTGCNTVILPVCAWQEHPWSTVMDSDTLDVMSPEDVANVCALARDLGLHVILKAMVNCRDGSWRAYIRFFDDPVPMEARWEDWFASWNRHVCLVADMAQENQADLFCVGCEMVGADHRDKEWRALIRDVRRHYGGPLSYNCDKYQEDRLTWWDAVDVISSSGYYPVQDIEKNLLRIEQVAKREQRPFMFMECGCPSRKGSQHMPNDWRFGGETDAASQEEWYQVFTQALLRHPFVRGTGWWDWPATRLYAAAYGPDNNGYCTYGKPANETLLRFSSALDCKDRICPL